MPEFMRISLFEILVEIFILSYIAIEIENLDVTIVPVCVRNADGRNLCDIKMNRKKILFKKVKDIAIDGTNSTIKIVFEEVDLL